MPVGDAIIELIVAPKTPQWLIDHAGDELTQDEIIWTTDGRWAFGVTGTPISGLTFFPTFAGGAVWGAITGTFEDQTDAITYITNADAAVLAAAQSYADALVVGLWDDRGNYDASGNTYPAAGGSGTAGAILKGDIWTCSVAGLGMEVGDTIRALTDAPGQTAGNWAIGQNNIGYVAENSANKSTDINADQASNTKYASVKAVFDWATGLFQTLTNKDASGGYVGLTLRKINFLNTLGTFISFLVNSNTAARTYTFQDRNGIIADDTDLAAKADKQSGLISGGVLTVETIDGTGTLNDYRLTAANYYIVGTGALSSTMQTYLNIALCSTGNVRYVAFYGKTDGTIEKVEGTEGVSAVMPPPTVAGSVLINYSLVTDAGISAGIDLTGYMLKADKTTPAEMSAGTNDTHYNTAYAHANAGIETIISSSATPTAAVGANKNLIDYLIVTALAIAATFAAPTGTLVNNKKLMFRIKDNGIARALLFNSVFRFSTDLTAPTTTTVGKTLYLGFQYNSTDLKWDCLFKLYV